MPVNELACDCGDIQLLVHGQPLLNMYCHCSSCRSLFGLELLSASIWSPEAVERQVAAGAALIAHRQKGRRMWRYHCSSCGRLMQARNRHRHIVIPTACFRQNMGDDLPAYLLPDQHCHYEQRLLSVADDLPKHTIGYETLYPELCQTRTSWR